MSQDTNIVVETLSVAGTLTAGTIASTGTQTTANITTANITTANITAGSMAQQYGGATVGPTLANNGSITTGTRIIKLTAGSAVTGISMVAGTQDGQELTVLHTGAAASSITFTTAGSAAGSSLLATDFVISGLTCSKYVWEATTKVWYPVVF